MFRATLVRSDVTTEVSDVTTSLCEEKFGVINGSHNKIVECFETDGFLTKLDVSCIEILAIISDISNFVGERKKSRKCLGIFRVMSIAALFASKAPGLIKGAYNS